MKTDTSYFDKTIKSAMTFLSRWKASVGEMWELTSYHKSLRILLRREGIAGNLVIACLDPFMIKGPVRWDVSDLRVEATTRAKGGETSFRVVDETAGVEIVCGGLEVKENVKL
jgi:hypothetical protein